MQDGAVCPLRVRTEQKAEGGGVQPFRVLPAERGRLAPSPALGPGRVSSAPPGSQALGLRLTVTWGPGVQTADGGTSRPPEPRVPTPRPRLILFFWRTRHTLYCDPYSVCTPALGPPFGTG